MKNTKRIAWLLAVTMMVTSISVNSEVAGAKKKVPSLSKKSITLTVGQSTTIKVLNNKKKISWTSSKKKVATISKKGKITAKKVGKTNITAKFGKKKLVCKVSVKAKNDKKTNVVTPTAAPVVTAKPVIVTSVTSIEVLSNKCVEVTLNQPQALQKAAFTVENKRFAIGSYYYKYKIADVSTSNNQVYQIELDNNESISTGSYVKVSVAGIPGTAYAEQFYTGAVSNASEDRYFRVVDKGEKFINTISCDDGYGYEQILSVNVPEGVTYKIIAEEGYNSVKLEGTFANAGKYEGSIVTKDEFGNVETNKIIWMVVDNNTIVADADDSYALYYDRKGAKYISLSSSIRIAGGSGNYKYQILNQPAALEGAYSDEYSVSVEDEDDDYVYGRLETGIEAATDRVLDVKITDANNPSITTTVKWTIHVKQTRKITGYFKDAIGDVLSSVSFSMNNRDRDCKYQDYIGYTTIYDDTSKLTKFEVYAMDGVYDVTLNIGNVRKTFYKFAVNADMTKDFVLANAYPVELTDDSSVYGSWYDEDDNYYGSGTKIWVTNGTYNLSSNIYSGFNYIKKTVSFTVNGAKTTAIVNYTVTSKIAGDISLGEQKTVSFEPEDGSYQYYKFVPAESGTYKFYSVGSYDTYGILTDSNGSQLKSNDDSEYDENYYFLYDCEAGTEYYVGARLYSTSGNARQFDIVVEMATDEDE